ncbi:cysteine hydrolase [Sinirhodobacter populi]|uniref:Cysteine hydrolase n=2 Tax=Paenirhodobacter populi TaxID=2306993 RepID=A0A443KPP6_9RHOB|nr:cysteine hydrolase [Sinirhodobacter populi]
MLPGMTALTVIFFGASSVAAVRMAPEWAPFRARMTGTAIPNIRLLIDAFRDRRLDVIFARIACLLPDGRDRSLSQRKPGWNNLLLPADAHAAQIVPALAPCADEIVLTKTTDSALTGTNLRLILTNLGVTHVVCAGIFTDQCVSSTVRSLADESFDVLLIDDATAARTDALHERELEVLNMIYCTVMTTGDLIGFLPGAGPESA